MKLMLLYPDYIETKKESTNREDFVSKKFFSLNQKLEAAPVYVREMVHSFRHK